MNPTKTNTPSGSQMSFINAANLSITVNGIPFAYRDTGPTTGVPLVLFNHWGAVLDNFDPAIIDGLAQTRRVITTDYRGIGGSGGTAPLTVGEMADDAIQLMHALGFDTVDMLGFSLGGFVAQDIALKAPASQVLPVLYFDAQRPSIRLAVFATLESAEKKSRQRPDALRFPAAVESHHRVGQSGTARPRALADADADRQRRQRHHGAQ